MSLVWPLIVGLAVALALGGKLRRLASLRLRAPWLFYLGIGIRIAAFPFSWLPWQTPQSVAIPLSLLSFAVFVFAVAVNLHIPGLAIGSVGLLSNFLTTAVNGGHMPARRTALEAAGLHFTVSRDSAVAHHPHLSWLIDRWAAPAWVPWANVYSVGDVVISVGALVFALRATGALDRIPWPRPHRALTLMLRRSA
jgi:hypothetical protein